MLAGALRLSLNFTSLLFCNLSVICVDLDKLPVKMMPRKKWGLVNYMTMKKESGVVDVCLKNLGTLHLSGFKSN